MRKINAPPAVITRTAGYIRYDDLEPRTLKKIRGRFSIIIPSPIGGPPTTIRQYKTTRAKDGSKLLRLPRFGLFSELKCDVTCKIKPHPRVDRNRWTGKLNPNQMVIFRHITEHIFSKESRNQGRGGLTLKLEAGRGKTFIAMALISWVRRKTLIVVHTKGILIQWRDLIVRMFPDTDLGFYYSDKKVDGDIVIALIQSLSKDEFCIGGRKIMPAKYLAKFDFMVMDECHLMLSGRRSRIFWRGQCPYMLGLSATPKEDIQGRNPVSNWGMGAILDAEKLEGYQVGDVNFTGRVHMIKYKGPRMYTKSIINEYTGMVSVPAMITQIMRDPHRLLVISQEIIKLMNKGLNILVFADRRQYLLDIRAYMGELGINCGMAEEKEGSHASKKRVGHDRVSRLVGGASEEHVASAEKNAQVILTTYQYMSVGKSIPRMNAMVLASPRKSYNEQTIKRIFRLGSDTTIERQIVDIVDWNTTLKSQWYSRNEYFRSQKYAVEKRVVEWDSDAVSAALVRHNISSADAIAHLEEMLGSSSESESEIK